MLMLHIRIWEKVFKNINGSCLRLLKAILRNQTISGVQETCKERPYPLPWRDSSTPLSLVVAVKRASTKKSGPWVEAPGIMRSVVPKSLQGPLQPDQHFEITRQKNAPKPADTNLLFLGGKPPDFGAQSPPYRVQRLSRTLSKSSTYCFFRLFCDKQNMHTKAS